MKSMKDLKFKKTKIPSSLTFMLFTCPVQYLPHEILLQQSGYCRISSGDEVSA
jgi:hypothetical protein